MTYGRSRRPIGGLILIVLGLLLLLAALGAISFGNAMAIFWSLGLILIGLLIIWTPGRLHYLHHLKQSGVAVGDIRIGDSEWDLKDMETRVGAGQLRLDLTKARIQPGETRLKVSGGMGKIEILAPSGLSISVQSEVGAGSINILGQKADGVGRQVSFTTPGYETAEKKVRMDLSLMIGELSLSSVG